MFDPTKDPAVSVAFWVEIDDQKLGFFNSCEGLGMEVVIEQREEGGNNNFVWQLPTRTKYSNIKLSRPLTRDTEKVINWFTQAVQQGTQSAKKTGLIKAMTVKGTEIVSWALVGVIPVRWTGPSLNPDSPKVATETIEIAHHGFKVQPGQN